MTVGTWQRGQYGAATVVVTAGSWPVHFLEVDIPNDGLPAWQFVVPDVRPLLTVTVGPFARAHSTTVTTTLVDERGCSATITQPVTVTR